MEISTIIFLIVLVVIVAIIIVYFNKLIKRLNQNQDAFIDVDTALKKRYDLMPNLEAVTKVCTKQTNRILEKLNKIKEEINDNLSVPRRQKVEDKFSGIIKEIFDVATEYPELIASPKFVELKNKLADIEEEIEKARINYNTCTRNYNILVEKFPTNLLAKLFGFKKSSFFEVDFIVRDPNEIIEVIEEKKTEVKVDDKVIKAINDEKGKNIEIKIDNSENIEIENNNNSSLENKENDNNDTIDNYESKNVDENNELTDNKSNNSDSKDESN